MILDNPMPWGYLTFWPALSLAFLALAALRVRPLAFVPLALIAFIRAGQVILSVVEFHGKPTEYLIGLQSAQAAAQSLLIALGLGAFFAYRFTPPFKRRIEWLLTGLCLFACVSLFWLDSALFTNDAIAAVCAVSLLPLAARRLRVWILPFMGIAAYGIYRTNEKIGLGLFALLTLLGLWNLRLRKISGLAGVALLALAMRYLPVLQYHWDDRMKIWDLMVSHVWDDAFWFGFGPGSTWASVRYLQQQAFGGVHEAFLMAHNDYLQLFYELGLMGTLAGLLAWGTVLKGAWKRPALRATLLCWSAAAVVHFPLHDPLSLVAVTGSVWLALN